MAILWMKNRLLICWNWVAICAWSILVSHGAEPLPKTAPSDKGRSSAVLRTAEQVHLLTRDEAANAHRAIIRGVVTCALPDSEAAVLQDSTRGIYIDGFNRELGESPRTG